MQVSAGAIATPGRRAVRPAMVDWEWLIGDSVIGALLPQAYARYRRPIVEGLRFFLTRLPAQDARADPRRPDGPSRECLGRGTPGRPGRALSRAAQAGPGPGPGPSTGPRAEAHLQRLESLPATTPIEAIEATLKDELGPLDALGVTLQPPPIAEASVAVVVPFACTRPGPELPVERGVFKVLKPGIEERLDRELGLLQEVGGFLDDRCAAFGIRR